LTYTTHDMGVMQQVKGKTSRKLLSENRTLMRKFGVDVADPGAKLRLGRKADRQYAMYRPPASHQIASETANWFQPCI
jgi:hypothetical protein